MNKKEAILLIKNLAHEARRGWDYLDGLASAKQIEDNQSRITRNEKELIQYIEDTAAKEEDRIVNYDCHIEINEYHTERLLARSEGMNYNQARDIKTMLNKILGENMYVTISID